MPVGYSSKCKLCNSPYRADAERWHSIENLTNKQISDRLAKRGEKISYESVRRHMVHHFNIKEEARKIYEESKLKSLQVMDEAVDKVLDDVKILDKVIQDNFIIHQGIKDIINEHVQNKWDVKTNHVTLFKTSSEEVRQAIKQKKEILGEEKVEDNDKHIDLNVVLSKAWDKRNGKKTDGETEE